MNFVLQVIRIVKDRLDNIFHRKIDLKRDNRYGKSVFSSESTEETRIVAVKRF